MRYLRPSSYALPVLTLLMAEFLAMIAHASLSRYNDIVVAQQQHLVSELGLSDLALLTEARYTRHPSMADLHTAFQDHPVSLDHFPTGSLVAPPAHLNTLKSAIHNLNDGRSGHAIQY